MDIKAYGKINLTLDVLYRRPDGYHQLRGVMCAVDVYDAVHMERSEGVSVTFDDAVPPQNTAVTAARPSSKKPAGARTYTYKKAYPPRPAWAAQAQTPPECCGA